MGKDFANFYKWAISRKNVFFKENISNVSTSVMATYQKNSKIFIKILSLYKNFNYQNTRFFPYSPSILTAFLNKNGYHKFDWEINKKDDVEIFDLLKIRDKNTILKYSTGSWGIEGIKLKTLSQNNFIYNWKNLEKNELSAKFMVDKVY